MKNLTITSLALSVAIGGTLYAEGELNLYSSRHYDTDERLYSDFEDMTGIRINRIEGKGDELITRLKVEGKNSPADILLTVETSRLERAKNEGVLQAIESEVFEARVPNSLQDSDNQWFGFSQRARIIFHDKNDVANPPLDYLSFVDQAYKGLVCHRLSIEDHGEEKATEWAKGVVANFARDPQGGDTDQIRGLASGECEISISNTYYFARAAQRRLRIVQR